MQSERRRTQSSPLETAVEYLTVLEDGVATQLVVVDSYELKTGQYDPLNPQLAGGTFQFVMRDVDGLPVVSEMHEAYPRLEDFYVELRRANHNETKRTRLRTTFIGNKQREADGTFRTLRGQQRAPRENDGRVEVVVELVHAGPHYVTVHNLKQRFDTLWFHALSVALKVRG